MAIGPLDEPEARVPLAESTFHHVTVFSDRAEICRRLEYSPSAPGSQTLVIHGLPDTVDRDSIRAKTIRAEPSSSPGSRKNSDISQSDFRVEAKSSPAPAPSSTKKEKPPIHCTLQEVQKFVCGYFYSVAPFSPCDGCCDLPFYYGYFDDVACRSIHYHMQWSELHRYLSTNITATWTKTRLNKS